MRQLCLVILICLAHGFAIYAQSQDGFAEIDHVVVAGETLTFIANTYGLTVDDIAASNDIDPGAILRVGQSLRIVFPVAEPTPAPTATATPSSAQHDRVDAIAQEVPAVPASDRSDAPVMMADAPSQDLPLLDPQLCVAMFADKNRNTALDPGESIVPGGAVALHYGDASKAYDLAEDVDTLCIDGLSRQVYDITMTAPVDHSLTGSTTLRLDLRNGMPLELNIGVLPGDFQPAPDLAAPPSEPAQADTDNSQGLLPQISGLLVVGLAAIVLISGFGLALVLRLR